MPANGEVREVVSHGAAERKGFVGGVFAPAARWTCILVRLFAFLIVAFRVVRTFLLKASRIPTSSMERTLLAGDHLHVNKASHGSGRASTRSRLPAFVSSARGDVTVFSPPHDSARGYVARVDRYLRSIEPEPIRGRPLFVDFSCDPAAAGRLRRATGARRSRIGTVIR